MPVVSKAYPVPDKAIPVAAQALPLCSKVAEILQLKGLSLKV
jgi:hypothetical protein